MATESAELGLVDALVQLSFAVQSVLAKAGTRHDLTVQQIRLLGILRDREPGILALARHLGLDKSSVTGLVDRAERRGLVQRASAADDGRAVRVSSTPLGRRLTERVNADIDSQISTLGDVLSRTDQQILGRLVSQLIIGEQAKASGSTAMGETDTHGQR